MIVRYRPYINTELRVIRAGADLVSVRSVGKTVVYVNESSRWGGRTHFLSLDNGELRGVSAPAKLTATCSWTLADMDL